MEENRCCVSGRIFWVSTKRCCVEETGRREEMESSRPRKENKKRDNINRAVDEKVAAEDSRKSCQRRLGSCRRGFEATAVAVWR